MRRLLILVAMWASLAAAGVAAAADSLGEVRAGNAAFTEGRYEAAVEAYTRAILAGDLDPEALALTFNNRGVAYSELGDYDRAIQDYNQALTLRPGDATSIKNLRIGYVRRAGANANLGEHEQALADYAKAVELEPGHAPTYVRRGQLHLERGDLQQALADLRKARELDPANREAGQLLARAEASLAAANPSPPTPSAAAPQASTLPPSAEVSTAAIDTSASAAAARPGAAAPSLPEPAAGAGTLSDQQQQPGTGAATARPRPPVQVAEGPPRRFRTVQAVNYREGPGNDYPRAGTLNADTVVNVVGQAQGWMMIRLQSGKEGFVYQRWLEPVAE